MFITIVFIIACLVIILHHAFLNTKKLAINIINPNEIHNQDSLLNILQISDMHIENISITPEELYQQLKNYPIDLITLTGDFLDRKRSIPKLVPYLDVLNRLNPTHGIYAVFGNHDYFLNARHFHMLKTTLEENGCTTLQNESTSIIANDYPLNIIGVDDCSTKRNDEHKSYKYVQNGYNLILTHDPNLVLSMKNFHFDYLLAGHFHGGQIHWPKPYHLAKLGRKMMKLGMIKGLHLYDDKPFYISEGLGQTGLNIRIGSRPEVTIHRVSLNVSQKKITSTA